MNRIFIFLSFFPILCASSVDAKVINKTNIVIVQGNITKQNTQAIVNAANIQLQHGSGIAGAIRVAAGPQLQTFCNHLPKKYNGHRCAVGNAVCTPSFNLQKNGITHIIHTAGPDCRIPAQNNKKTELLKQSYTSSLYCAHQNKITTIAFPPISTGIFGYSSKEAAQVAVSAVVEYAKKYTHFKEIRLVAFNAPTHALYLQELSNCKGNTSAPATKTMALPQNKKPSLPRPSLIARLMLRIKKFFKI